MSSLISAKKINKFFLDDKRKKLQALLDIDLEVKQGQFLVLLGPSGCGKSTLLRIFAGLDSNFEGNLEYSKDFNFQEIGFVFQDFALLPWLNVEQNIGLGLLEKAIPEHTKAEIINKEMKSLGLDKYAKHFPHELSGGQKQRVGIARALVVNPKIIFMDEPFSALDSFNAKALREDLLKIWLEKHITIVLVTHNILEAIELADEIVVMSPRPGRIEKKMLNSLARPRSMRSEQVFVLEDELYKSVKP